MCSAFGSSRSGLNLTLVRCVPAECGGAGLTESFVMPTVAATDQSRAVWPSCPASGWASGVDRLTARPNGKTLRVGVGPGTTRAQWPLNAPVKMPLESHGGYVGLGGGGAGKITGLLPTFCIK